MLWGHQYHISLNCKPLFWPESVWWLADILAHHCHGVVSGLGLLTHGSELFEVQAGAGLAQQVESVVQELTAGGCVQVLQLLHGDLGLNVHYAQDERRVLHLHGADHKQWGQCEKCENFFKTNLLMLMWNLISVLQSIAWSAGTDGTSWVRLPNIKYPTVRYCTYGEH